MKTYRILIAEHYGKEIDIEAKTEKQAKEIFLTKGLPDDIDREVMEYQIESIEEQK
jgi:hypothetical protein